MSKLCVQQTDGVAPGTESARHIFYAGFPCYLGDFVPRNKIANLAKNIRPGTCWFDFFVFHPCRVAGSKRQANTFFRFSVGWLWKQFIILSRRQPVGTRQSPPLSRTPPLR